MILVIHIVIAIFWMSVVPYCIGSLYTLYKNIQSSLVAFVAGYIIQMALFEIISLPMIFLKLTLTAMLWIYCPILIFFAGLSLVLNYKSGRIFKERLRKKPLKLSFLGIVAVLFVFSQVLLLTVFVHTDDDDAFYVGSATIAVETNSMYRYDSDTGLEYEKLPKRYILSPMPIYTAAYSSLTGISAATIAHTIMPMVLIPIAYGIYVMIGLRLFKGDLEKTALFIIFTAFVIFFSGYSAYTQGAFLLFRIWQGKAFLASALLPALFLWFLVFQKENPPQKGDWLMLFLILGSCCMVSSMGIMLGAISVGILALVHLMMERNLKNLGYAALACLPNVVLSIVYLFLP